MKPELFRKASLERLASPERLDSLMEVVHLQAWIALLACAAVLMAGLVWGFLGSLAEEVRGEGILSREGGYFQVGSPGSGSLRRVLVKPNDHVVKDQVLAVLWRPDLEDRIRDVELQRAAMVRQKAEILPLAAQEQAAQLAAIREQQAQLQETARTAQERIAFLSQHLQALGTALDKGLITPDLFQDTKRQLVEAQERLAGTESRAHELAAQISAGANRVAQKAFDLDLQVQKLQSQADLLRGQLEQEGKVVSPFDGTILEVLKEEGQGVAQGAPILRMEVSTRPVICYLLVPAEGKRLQAGMAVQMEPAGVRREEFGMMLGRVRDVSPNPMSIEGVDALLENRALATQLGGKGNAYLVEVLPEFDPATASGFRWTSRQGPPGSFGSGTLLTGWIQVRRQAPITLVVPAIRKWLRG
ncbi:MAG: NHLP bacteriocin system secretion protein [Holophaga sp.]|nr:NHLP bacteriocin system secretion protein [Holophaga sp.]